MISLIPTTLRLIFASLLWSDGPLNDATPLRFQLRHQHAVSNGSRVVFSDIATSFASESYAVSTRDIDAHRPASYSAFDSARLRSMRYMQSERVAWENVKMLGPKVQSRETLLQLAQMTHNSYFESGHPHWYDLGERWNTSTPFGWEPDEDGFRGHVFVSDDNSTVVVSVKGTSAGWLAGGSGPTVKKDKLNDNLLFSCCCAKVGPTWAAVCNCHSGGYKCDQTCLQQSLLEESLFYPIGINLYNNVTYMYPDAKIWMIGHSLGGALASLVAATFGVPAVTFEAPGERLAATRLHLPMPPSLHHITHVFHTADPIAMGICNGVTSACAIGGYAMESRCHLGRVIQYDTVTKNGWSVDVRTHAVKVVIEKILHEDWELPSEDGEGQEVPGLEEQTDCVECSSWEYGDFKNH